MQTVGIIGGAGFIGSYVTKQFLENGYRVKVSATDISNKEKYAHLSGLPNAANMELAPLDVQNLDQLKAFAAGCDVVTYEFENIPAAALDLIEARAPVRPNRRALEISQDRLTEKTFLRDLGLATAAFASVNTSADLHAALALVGLPAILKTRRLGYDGKGQARIDAGNGLTELESLRQAPAIVEGFVRFSKEISVIAARGLTGEVVCFDPGENEHRGGILHKTTVPARIPSTLSTDAVLLAARILNALEYVGVMGVELFVTEAGLVVNEVAPRVHNSGHWTQNGCAVDQFEQHIRAITGWALGDGSRHADVEMENLIGDDIEKVPDLARVSATAIHLYGKANARPGRKMGHVNRILLRPGY